jgi:Domain of unknown function (DUF4265)
MQPSRREKLPMTRISSPKNPIAVFVSVEQDENGYPSVSREQLWCIPVGENKCIVDNIPFYAREISMGDEIYFQTRNSEHWFNGVSKPSRNTTLRTFARKDGLVSNLVTKIRSFGGLTEKMEGSPVIAVSLPPSANIAGALDYLDRESDAGNVGFEESCVRYR